MLALLFTPVASAQDPKPTFDLQAPSGCGADPGYTCVPAAVVTNYSPFGIACGPPNCHYEYCFIPQGSGTCNRWHNDIPMPISLGTSPANGLIDVNSQYRRVTNGIISTPSQIGTASITYIGTTTGPTVYVNSPNGILSGTSVLQSQLINSDVGQFVTYQAASALSGTGVSVTFQACPSCSTGVTLPQTEFFAPNYTLPSVWGGGGVLGNGWTPGATAAYSYIQLTAQDDAGNHTATTPPSGTPFMLFDWTTTTEKIVCAAPPTCSTLADGTSENSDAGDIPGDPPSGPVGGNTFQGYADPTMRADTLVTSANPNGTNLWLGYTWPRIQQFSGGTPVGTDEIHLAYSDTNSGANGGASWCSGGACSTPLVIYPSAQHGSAPYSFSSHEVLNLWPHVVQPSAANSYTGTQTWYGASLMYFRYLGDTLKQDIQNNGCLVVATTNLSQNTQDPPSQLAWSTANDPASCSASIPGSGIALGWTMLTNLVTSSTLPQPASTCVSWGEPAIMVSPDGTTIYLAASCFDINFIGQGYYIFTAPATGTSSTSFLNPINWGILDETFSFSSLPLLLLNYLSNYQYTTSNSYLTEFDWAIRADGTIVAVVTPAGYTTTGTAMQFGCVALTFTLGSGVTAPFGSYWATLRDNDTTDPAGYTEPGPNGCAYEPTSNNGVVIVRNLVNSTGTVKTYSLVNTALKP